jgi:hypothetical protein
MAGEFRARDIANIVNALARVGVWDENLFRKMSTIVRGMTGTSVFCLKVLAYEAFRY